MKYSIPSKYRLVERIQNPTVPRNETVIWKYWKEFVHKYLRTGRSEVTVRNVLDALLFIIRVCNIVTIEKCNSPKILEDTLFSIKEKRNLRSSTYNSYIKNLNTYFRWLAKQEYIQENKINKVACCKEENNEQLTLSEQHIQAIVKQVHDRRQTRLERARNVFFIDLLRFTGARSCEITAMKVGDIEPLKDSYKIRINGAKQKGKPRYYELPSSLRDSYETYMIKRNKSRPDEEMLFVSSSKRTGWTLKGMSALFRKLSNELGFRITAYGFRRYVATSLYEETTDMRHIGDYFGHTRASTTLGYVNSCCARTKPAALIMEKRLNSVHAFQST